MRRLLYVPALGPLWLQVLGGLALAGVATLLGKILPGTGTAAAAMYYMLAVIMAAFVGRLGGGLAAAGASFLGLNFFFTQPLGTFRVAKAPDIVALVAFLLVAALIAALLTEVLAQRSEAERGRRESNLLYRLSSGLLSKQRLQSVLEEVAGDLTQLFDLEDCRVELGPEEGRGKGPPGGPSTDFPLRTNLREYGVVRLWPGAEREISPLEAGVARAIASQIALAVEATSLDEESRKAKAEAEVSRIRAGLFSSVTHDLKTPLSTIKASATSLLDRTVSFDEARREELLQGIVVETDRLNRLISNLLQLSRLRAGVLAARKTPTPITEIIESVTARLGPAFHTAGVSLLSRTKGSLSSVPMDVIQIDQALSNVLENALRYAPKNTQVQVTARRWHGFIEVLVSDRGPGIEPGERERVFEEFYGAARGDSKGTTGLGLAIVRAIISAHGGRTWVEQTPGGGATVGFSLPFVPRMQPVA